MVNFDQLGVLIQDIGILTTQLEQNYYLLISTIKVIPIPKQYQNRYLFVITYYTYVQNSNLKFGKNSFFFFNLIFF